MLPLLRIAPALLLLPLLAVGAPPAFAAPTGSMPEIRDDDFVVERFASGIPGSPTTMAFVGDADGSGNDDILVLQKHDGQVRLVRDGSVQPIPVLDANVANLGEQGMLGIAAVGDTVYLYYSESDRDGGEAIGKRVYKYDWTGSQLVNPVLVRDLDETQFYHNGGGMVAAPDGAVYLAVGDAGRYGALQNHSDELFEDTSVIMRVDKDGEPYYSIGVRNSFGLAIDPVTGRLWDTENGDDDYDEINLVERNSNSGWYPIMGPATGEQVDRLPGYYDDGYQYSDPEFSWEQPVAPTGLAFAESEALKKFSGSLFVGDCTAGNLYRLELNESRDGFAFTSPHLSADNVANRGESQDEIIFGTGFGCVTDVEVGPDGLLYIVSLSEGTIFRIVPEGMAMASTAVEQGGQGDFSLLFYPAMAVAGAGAGFAAYTIRKKSRRM
jgi:glucose/arabinose dehydrogenase